MTKSPILIFCRIKPYSHEDCDEIQEYSITKSQDKETLTISTLQSNQTLNHKPDSYNFQFVKVFDHAASQGILYQTVAQPVVHSVLNGYNGTIFAYGQTGSGKTYTISGDQDNQGIVPRALFDIFTAIEQAKEKYDVKMSYLEIYNEHSNDLLIPLLYEKKKKIMLRENADKIMEWQNLSLFPVQTYSEALNLLAIGDNNRIVCDTPMNIFSSRSHTILTIYLTAALQDSFEIRKAKLNLVDLAGSERVHKMGEEGIVLEEARHINLSLHYLEQVIVALSNSARSHVPYRNCTMTSALRDSLGGNCITVMIANIAVNKANLEETISTCRFAQRVALVRNDLLVNTERDLVGENHLLREEILRLQKLCNALQTQIKEWKQNKSKEDELSQLPSIHKNKLEKIDLIEQNTCSSAAILSDLDSNTVPSSKAVLSTPPCMEMLSTQQLQTDIIHLIGWLQDEMKAKNGSPDHSNTSLNFSSVLQTVDQDERFEKFISAIEDEEGWMKLKEEEQQISEALSVKVNEINSVHEDILSWWRRDEKSLVQEVLAGRPLRLGTASSRTGLSSSRYEGTVDSLLSKHSDLLTDFQLLKSKLKISKWSLQRIQRKYSVEFSSWKKNEIDHPEQSCIFMKSDDNNLDINHFKLSESEKQRFSCHNDKIKQNSSTHYMKESLINNKKSFNLKDEDLISESSFSICESDLNTTIGELNDSVYSSPHLSEKISLSVMSGQCLNYFWHAQCQEVHTLSFRFHIACTHHLARCLISLLGTRR